MLENLRKLRDESGVTQRQLADAIGVSQQSINKYENHNIEPDIGTLIRIAEYFDTSVDYLVGHSAVRRKVEPICRHDLNSDEEKILSDYRKLNQKQRRAVALVMASFLEE